MKVRTRKRLFSAAALLVIAMVAWWIISTALSLLITLVVLAALWHFGRPALMEWWRVRRLCKAYPAGPELDDMLAKVIWSGQQSQQVRDSLGRPEAVETLARKTKTKEIWKYGHEGSNRYRLRITLDDGEVSTWKLR